MDVILKDGTTITNATPHDVIDCPDVDFPQVEFIGQPFLFNMPHTGYTDVTACNPECECIKIYPNDTVAPPFSSEIDERNSW